MNAKPRILVLTLSFGAGHVSAAQSVASEFQKQIPECEVRLIDALENCSLAFKAFYVWTYWAMIRYAPRVWEKFFNSRIERDDKQTAPVWIWKKGCRKVFDEIRSFQPDLIVAAEVGASEIAVIARRENLTNAAIVNVITDYEAEPIWVKPEISAYAVATELVKKQLENWGANAEKIEVCGIPLNESFARKHDANETRKQFNLDERPIVLLMGGGMGPTRMAEVAAHLLQSGKDLQIVALPAKDEKAQAALGKLQNSPTVALQVVGWTNSIAELMQTAQVLATKPGGVTLSEAAACALPLVLFDRIPGPEDANTVRFVEAGAAISTENPKQTADEIVRLLHDGEKLQEMSADCRQSVRPDAARRIVELARKTINLPIIENKTAGIFEPILHRPSKTGAQASLLAMSGVFYREQASVIKRVEKLDGRFRVEATLNASRDACAPVRRITSANKIPTENFVRPILILRINNGAAHTVAAEAIAAAWTKTNRENPARIVEVSEFMSPLARFTHVSAYLWLVKNAPKLWGKIDAYQKRQTQTSPEWFYRRECRKLFDFVERIQPLAIVATEVGCGEIGALLKHDLGLKIPLVAVNLDYEADRAWIQKETDLYCLATDLIEKDFVNYGADGEKIKIWGVPLNSKFKRLNELERQTKRGEVCERLKLDANKPIILVSGGGEGLGEIEKIVRRLSELKTNIVVLCGRNEKLKTRCEKFKNNQIRVLGWTENVAELMQSADVSVSKLGLTFYEAMVCGLPIVALEPPPGAERIQYNLLEKFGVGRAVKTVDDLIKIVGELLADSSLLRAMREKTEFFGQHRAAENLALWLADNIKKRDE